MAVLSTAWLAQYRHEFSTRHYKRELADLAELLGVQRMREETYVLVAAALSLHVWPG